VDKKEKERLRHEADASIYATCAQGNGQKKKKEVSSRRFIAASGRFYQRHTAWWGSL
jgi:hypothetical protein